MLRGVALAGGRPAMSRSDATSTARGRLLEVQSYGVHRDVEMRSIDLDAGARESDTTMGPERPTRGTYDTSYGTLREGDRLEASPLFPIYSLPAGS
jgi:hypothetical protein